MESRDLQLGKIESLAEHVDTNDDPRRTRDNLLPHGLALFL
jgi:hypothetical protein